LLIADQSLKTHFNTSWSPKQKATMVTLKIATLNLVPLPAMLQISPTIRLQPLQYSSAYPVWGCRCCKPLDTIQYPVEAVLYTDQDLWDVYQYQNSADPICETGVPASWFLFFVDLVTPPQSSTATFFENEVDFEVKTVDVPITRDTNDRIVSLDVPFCGVVTVTYDDDGIVDSISDNALSCVYTA